MWLQDDKLVEAKVRCDLSDWFGADVVSLWRLLRIYRIQEAQEARPTGPWMRGSDLGKAAEIGVYACGDYCATPSLNGALESGRRAAVTLLSDL